MNITKRSFLKASGATLASLSLTTSALASSSQKTDSKKISELKNITANVTAISPQERLKRIEKAQQLMQSLDIAALIIEPGASMDYFSGIQWWRSERVTALIIPQ